VPGRRCRPRPPTVRFASIAGILLQRCRRINQLNSLGGFSVRGPLLFQTRTDRPSCSPERFRGLLLGLHGIQAEVPDLLVVERPQSLARTTTTLPFQNAATDGCDRRRDERQ
jgi:hypothetical protein